MLLHISHSFLSGLLVTGLGYVPSIKAILFLADTTNIIFLFHPPKLVLENGIDTKETSRISKKYTNRGLEGLGEKVSKVPIAYTYMSYLY